MLRLLCVLATMGHGTKEGYLISHSCCKYEGLNSYQLSGILFKVEATFYLFYCVLLYVADCN